MSSPPRSYQFLSLLGLPLFQIVRCALTNELRADPSVTSVLLTDKMYSPKKQREKIAEILFGVFDIEGYYVGLQTLLPMYQ